MSHGNWPERALSACDELRAGSTALMIIDMQRCYFDDPELERLRAQVTDHCNALIECALEIGVPVINVRTEHHRDRSTWTLNMLADGEGFAFEGDADAQFLPDLRTCGTIELLKTRDSAFVDTRLDELLTDRGIVKVVIAGVSTHTCIALTAADAYARNFDVVLVEDAIASHRPQIHRFVLQLLQREYRQTLAFTDVRGGVPTARE